MALKDRFNKELTELKAWAADAELQAKLAKSEAGSELRKAWMEAQQDLVKLEARVEQLGGEVDSAVSSLVTQLRERWTKLRNDL